MPVEANVGKKYDLLVAKIVGNFGKVGLREGDEDIFSLCAVDRVAETPSTDGAAALGEVTAEAIIALAARSDGPN